MALLSIILLIATSVDVMRVYSIVVRVRSTVSIYSTSHMLHFPAVYCFTFYEHIPYKYIYNTRIYAECISWRLIVHAYHQHCVRWAARRSPSIHYPCTTTWPVIMKLIVNKSICLQENRFLSNSFGGTAAATELMKWISLVFARFE